MSNKLLAIFIIFLNIIISFSCQQQKNEVIENNLIDSLICTNRINNNTILISFGADAITAINTQKGVVVIDAGISTELTSKYRKIIEAEFHRNDFKYVINTHCHPDHYGGNKIFCNAEVIGQENGISEIIKQRNDTLKVINNLSKIVDEYESDIQKYQRNTNDWVEAFTQKIRYYYALNDAKNKSPILQPTLTFADSMQIESGDIKFEMLYFGKCHSNSDILIFVPELKMLFTGDLFFKYGSPSIMDEQIDDIDNWKRAVNWIEKRIPKIETIISGHGKSLKMEDLENFNRIISAKCTK